MPYCESCLDPTQMEPVDDAAVCPRCSRTDPIRRRPFLVVTGASGAGKSTVFAPLARELVGEAAVFDIDLLIEPFAIQAQGAPLNWPAIRAAWLSVASGVAQDCPDDVRRQHLEARPAWRGRRRSHGIDEQTKWGTWLRDHIVESVDTGQYGVDETVRVLAEWARSLSSGTSRDGETIDGVDYRWRGAVSDGELVALTDAYGGRSELGWWDRIRRRSLGWVTARVGDGMLIGFVNVAWDGGDHAFLLDPKVRPDHQRRGIGTELVRRAAD